MRWPKENKETNNDRQSTTATVKSEDWAIWTSTEENNGVPKVSSSCATSDSRCGTLDIHPVIRYGWGKIWL